MEKMQNAETFFCSDSGEDLLNDLDKLIVEVLKDPEAFQKQMKKEGDKKKKELERIVGKKGLTPFLSRASHGIVHKDDVHKDETRVFIIRQTTVIEIDQNDPEKVLFVSDKLSNMCGAFFDHRGNRLLVFNTSGHAFLYDMATGDKLLPKIYLKASDLEGEGMAVNDGYLWYLDKKRGRIKRLNLLDGSVENVLQDSSYKFIYMIQKEACIYAFAAPQNAEQSVKITRYQIQNGELIEHFSRLERAFEVGRLSPRHDLNGKEIIFSLEKWLSGVEFYVFCPEKLNLKLLCEVSTTENMGYFCSYHTNLDAGQILMVLANRVLLVEAESGKIIKEIAIEYGANGLFLDQHTAFISTWEKMYKLVM